MKNSTHLTTAVTAILILASAIAYAADNKKPSAHPADQPGFERPLVIDRKLEKDVKALQERVAALEKTVADLQKEIKSAVGTSKK